MEPVMNPVSDFNIAGKMKYDWMKPIGFLQAQRLLGDGLVNSEFSLYYMGVSWYFNYKFIPDIARALVTLQLCHGSPWWNDIKEFTRIIDDDLPDILSPHDKMFVRTCFFSKSDSTFDRLRKKIKGLKSETFEEAALEQHPDLKYLFEML